MKKILNMFFIMIISLFACVIVKADTSMYVPLNHVLVEGQAEGDITLMLVNKAVLDVSQIKASDIGYVAQCDSMGRYKFDFTFERDIQDYSVLVSNENGVISDTVDIAYSSIEAIDFDISIINDDSVSELIVNTENKFGLTDAEYTMILAVYDDNGALIQAALKSNTSEIINDKISIPKSGQVKAFIWSDVKNIIPICKPLSEKKEYKTIYVSADGDDGNSGEKESPLAGVEAAVRKAKEYAAENTLKGGKISIVLEEGTYRFTNGFVISDVDFSGTELEIKAYNDEIVKLTTSCKLNSSEFKKVTDENIISKVPESARDNLYVIDLAAEGITDYGELEQKISSKASSRTFDLYFNGEPLTLSRYPNNDYSYISEVTKNNAEIKELSFKTADERWKRWINADDMRIYGFFSKGWFDCYMNFSVNDETGEILPCDYPDYGAVSGGRFFVYNLIEELDIPGEYYLDRSNGKLYIYPPSDIYSADIEYVNKRNEYILNIHNCKNVSLKNIELYGNAGDGIFVSADTRQNPSENINIKNCRVYGVTEAGVNLGQWRVKNTRIDGCEILKTGSYGITTNQAGNMDTLERADIYIVNNHIHDYAVYNKCYRPGIYMAGCGIRAEKNLIHSAPHSAIHFGGYDNVIENNYVYDVLKDIDDGGAFYTGRSWLGNTVIQGNVIRDCKGYGNAIIGIYVDDLGSGVLIRNNILINIHSGVAFGGGIYNTLENNLFIACKTPYSYDVRGIGGYSDDVVEQLRQNVVQRYENDAYIKAFPYIEGLLENEPEKTLGSKISDNIVSNCGNESIAHLVRERNEISDPIVCNDIIYSIFSDGELELFNVDESIFNMSMLKEAGLDGTGNYTLPVFYVKSR